MSFRFYLATISAFAAMAGVALADDNFSNVIQNGNDNSGIVTQGPGIGNFVGSDGFAARQKGNRNVLEFRQSGDANEIGTSGTGFFQDSNRNNATVTQSSNGNKVLQITQTGISDLWFGSTPDRNKLSIDQGGGDGNTIKKVTQTRTSVLAGIDVLPGNMANLSFSGRANGVGEFDPSTAIDGAWSSLHQAEIHQHGASNKLGFTVIGDSNLFAFSQKGADNVVDGKIAGDSNQLGVVQEGIAGKTEFSVSGERNQLYVRQGLSVLHAGNQSSVTLDGNDNSVGLLQDGWFNQADLTIDGNSNLLNVSQSGTNSLTIGIWGSNNNDPAIGFSGVAASTADLVSPSLLPGQVIQNGLLNAINYNVGPGPAPGSSDSNRFAFAQDGNGNEIVGKTIGSHNQVVVVQNGNSNFTSFSQIGNGNTIGVSQ